MKLKNVNVLIEYRFKSASGERPRNKTLICRIIDEAGGKEVKGIPLIPNCYSVDYAMAVAVRKLHGLTDQVTFCFDELIDRPCLIVHP